MNLPITRRDFLAATAATVAATPALARASQGSPPSPSGVVYARSGPEGFRAGTADRPSRGMATTLDGRSLEVAHATSWRIAPGKGLLIAPDGDGGWSILYAET